MRKQKITRRALAVFCAVCIALLQCFVLLPAVTGHVYADGSIDLTGYVDGNDYHKEFDGSVDGDISDLLKKAGVTPSEVKFPIGSDIGELKSDDRIKKSGGNYCIIETVEDEEGTREEERPISWIEFNMKSNYNPVDSISINKIGDVKAGSKTTLKYGSDYTIKGDAFFEGKGFSDFIEATVEGDDGNSINDTSIEFTAGKSGTTVKVTIKGKGGKPSASKSAKVVPKAFSVSPSSKTLTVGESVTCTVKADGTTISNSNCAWSSSKSSIATVSSGLIRGVKAGKTTITVKYNGSSATVSVTVKERKTYSYSRSTYTPYHPTRSSNTLRTSGTGTGATRPSTAARPTETASTAAPSFQTMKVKEVYLTPMEQPDSYTDDGFADDSGDEWDDEESNDGEDFDEDGVTFPAAAGSAAAAAAVCGAGVVGRIRKFHIDMGDITSLKDTAAGGDGGMGGDGSSAGNGADAGSTEGEAAEKPSRNPFKKFRK